MSSSDLSRLNLADLVHQDPVAWKVAFSVVWPLAWRVARAVLGNSNDLDDVAAEAVAQLPRLVSRLCTVGELEAMAIVVARRRAISHRRTHTALKRDARLVDGSALLENASDGHDLRREIERTHDLRVWLARLDPRSRQLVEAHFLDGKTSVELAQTCDLNESTIRGLISEAVRMMYRSARSE